MKIAREREQKKKRSMPVANEKKWHKFYYFLRVFFCSSSFLLVWLAVVRVSSLREFDGCDYSVCLCRAYETKWIHRMLVHTQQTQYARHDVRGPTNWASTWSRVRVETILTCLCNLVCTRCNALKNFHQFVCMGISCLFFFRFCSSRCSISECFQRTYLWEKLRDVRRAERKLVVVRHKIDLRFI